MKKFSIIVPVRNGGEYVKDCVRSILSQTIDQFDLIVLDNYSTDGTPQWINSLEDERIIIHHSDISLTIEENWSRILSVPKGEFMTIIGHDDLLKPGYLNVMNDLVEQFPEASLYFTHFHFINSSGKQIRKSRSMKEIQNGSEFLESILNNKIDIVGTGFMLRTKDYEQIGGIPVYPNLLFSDFELWIRAATIRSIAISPENVFAFRLHQSTTSVSPDDKMFSAFEKFILFLKELKKDDQLNKVITENGNTFILHHCRGLVHRLLRTPKKQREQLSVNNMIEKCKGYALLITGKKLNLNSQPTIIIAKLIDSNSFTRNIFLGFKKIYRKPVLK